MCLILIATIAFPASAIAQELPPQDAIRVREFYRWAAQIQDKIWPQWSQIPAPLLLVTDKSEFLAHHPAPPTDFKKISDAAFGGLNRGHEVIHETADEVKDTPVLSARGRLMKPSGRARD